MHRPIEKHQSLINRFGMAIWHMPGRFQLVKLFGPKYSLRCVLFHHISDQSSPFTDGMGVTTGRADFESRIRFFAKYYTPISLETFLGTADHASLPRRPILVTFDDAYASVAEVAAPICRKYGVPACFFVNASLLGNRDLSIDNLVCYVGNVFGFREMNEEARKIKGPDHVELRSRRQVTAEFLPTLSLEQRDAFKRGLTAALGLSSEDLAAQANLYLRPEQLGELASSNFEIGNHTFSHVHCRILSGPDFSREIDQNRSILEALSQTKVRAFSAPYGSLSDFTPALQAHLRGSGHQAAFLVESRANTFTTDMYQVNRVSIESATDPASFSEIEVLPRLRTIRDHISGRQMRWN